MPDDPRPPMTEYRWKCIREFRLTPLENELRAEIDRLRAENAELKETIEAQVAECEQLVSRMHYDHVQHIERLKKHLTDAAPELRLAEIDRLRALVTVLQNSMRLDAETCDAKDKEIDRLRAENAVANEEKTWVCSVLPHCWDFYCRLGLEKARDHGDE